MTLDWNNPAAGAVAVAVVAPFALLAVAAWQDRRAILAAVALGLGEAGLGLARALGGTREAADLCAMLAPRPVLVRVTS